MTTVFENLLLLPSLLILLQYVTHHLYFMMTLFVMGPSLKGGLTNEWKRKLNETSFMKFLPEV